MPSTSRASRPIRFGIVVLCAGLLAAAAWHPDAPPPAHTGGFGEPTCLDCHFDAPLNDAEGKLLVDGFPKRIRPGAAYDLTVRLAHPGMEIWGFQMAARFAGPGRRGAQAGSFAEAGAGVTVDVQDGIEYIRHEVAAGAADSARWSFRWHAPDGPSDTVAFHLAALAGNDDESPFGDFVYTWSESTAGR